MKPHVLREWKFEQGRRARDKIWTEMSQPITQPLVPGVEPLLGSCLGLVDPKSGGFRR